MSAVCLFFDKSRWYRLTTVLFLWNKIQDSSGFMKVNAGSKGNIMAAYRDTDDILREIGDSLAEEVQ